jgi:ribosomal protein S6
MQNKYKITLILQNNEQKESAEDVIDRIAGCMASLGGTVENKKNFGVREFERCVNRNFRSGTYAQYVVSAGKDFNAALCSRLRLDKTVNRVLVERI